MLTRGHLRRLVQPSFVLLTAAVLLPLLLFALAAWQNYHATLRETGVRAERTVRILQEHAIKVLESQRLVVEQVEDRLRTIDWSSLEDRAALHALLTRLQTKTDQVTTITITDAAGRMRASGRVYPADPRVDFADREWFKAFREGDAEQPFVGAPFIGRQTGHRVFCLAGPAPRTRDGAFNGAIAASIDQGYFETFYRDIEPGFDHSVTLVRDDGVILARQPRTAKTNIADNQDLLRRMQSGAAGLYTGVSPIDGVERIYAYHKVGTYPVYVRFGISKRAALAPWYANFLTYGLVTGAASLALIAASALAVRQTAREGAARRNWAKIAAELRGEVAERGRVEDQLRQSQKMEAIGQLTGGVAHDFNNLLTVMQSSVDLLKRPNLSEERRRRYVDAIADATERAAKLTGQLLAFARRQALQPEVFDVCQSMARLADMLGTLSGSRIRVVTRTPSAPALVNADPSQFDTAIVNMAVNAKDAMDGEGTLTITVAPASAIDAAASQPAAPDTADSGGYVALSLTDTGTGMSPETLTRIFEPFFTTKGVGLGTGLGLSQVFGFAKQSGGEIRVESEIGRGTTFTLYLPQVARAERPAAGDAALPPAGPTAELFAAGHATRVLVVEDNPDVGCFATQTLAELGYATVWATNADEALAALAAGAERFDVVFSDVVMPGMNGIDLGHEIRRLYENLPVVLTSGYSDVLATRGACGFDLLNKPYTVADLTRVLGKATAGRAHDRTLSLTGS